MSTIHSRAAETTSVCRRSLQLNESDISRALTRTKHQFTAPGKAVMTISAGDEKKTAP